MRTLSLLLVLLLAASPAYATRVYETGAGGSSGSGSGDIESVGAGDGLTGGGVSGAVSLAVGAGTGITVSADDVAITANGVGPTQIDETANYAWSGASTVTGTYVLDADALRILDTGGDHSLIITPGTDLSVNRVLTLTTGDAARTITLSGNPTLSDWFDQAVKTTSSPTFDLLTLSDSAVTLTSETTGDYVASVATTAPLSGGAAGSEGATLTLSITANGIGTAQIDETADYSYATLSGKQDRNNSAVDDDDCTGEQGLWWYDTTDSRYEFCNANTGVPETLGAAGSGDVTDVWSCASGDCNQPVVGTGEYLDGGTATTDGTSEGILLPRSTDTSAATSEGQIGWDTDNTGEGVTVGDGTQAVRIGWFPITASWVGSSATRYANPGGEPNATRTNIDVWEAPFDMVCKEFHAEVNAAPGAGTSWTMSWYNQDSGAATGKSCSIADANLECDDDSDSVAMTKGTTYTFEQLRVSTAGAPGESAITMMCRAD